MGSVQEGSNRTYVGVSRHSFLPYMLLKRQTLLKSCLFQVVCLLWFDEAHSIIDSLSDPIRASAQVG